MIETILSTISSWITDFILSTGYLGILFLMAIESAGVPAPSEVIMPFAGFLAQTGALNFWPVVVAGTIGNLAGSAIAYWIGLRGGRPFLDKYGRYLFIARHDLDRAEAFFHQRGRATVFIGRLLPVIRTYISFPAGLAKMDFGQFCLYTVSGAFLWSVVLAYLGVRLGEHWSTIKEYTKSLDALIVIALLVGLVYWWRRHSWVNSKVKIQKSK